MRLFPHPRLSGPESFLQRSFLLCLPVFRGLQYGRQNGATLEGLNDSRHGHHGLTWSRDEAKLRNQRLFFGPSDFLSPFSTSLRFLFHLSVSTRGKDDRMNDESRCPSLSGAQPTPRNLALS